MPELRDARHLIDMAEHAAIAGDFSSADELLSEAARIQEAALGPLHPDLAKTLNNRAIVAEKTGRPGEAETFYRQAAAIASASLPADHPMVTESRQNLEDFCREHGLPLAAAAVTTVSAKDVSPPSSIRPSPAPRAPAPTASQSLPPPRRSPRQRAWVAIGVIALVTIAVVVKRPWSAREMSTAVPAAEQTPKAALPASAVPALPPPALPAPVELPPPPAVAPRSDDRDVVADKSPASAPASGTVRLASAQLCQIFSTSGDRWRCDPPRDSVPRGSIVLYTRVTSSRDTAIVHRWYREGILQQTITLTIRANVSEGYRTYSRQTIAGGGHWRVEVTTANGDLLHEENFAVQR